MSDYARASAADATHRLSILIHDRPRIASVATLCACALLSAPGQAQEPPAQTGPDRPVMEEIVVTGTRIARRDYESASPIVTVDSSLFDQSGSTTVQTMLNTLPQFAPWHTENWNNRNTGPDPGAGQAIMDLRGLGLGRTLVLLDGRRIVPSNAWGSVDVNLIPAAIIDRVEIISGGASAVYGSDAVAGVVNFKTRRFTGLETEASWEQTDRHDGTGWQAGITGGLEFTRGYAYGHFSYTERDPVMQGDRSFSSVALGYDSESQEFYPLGSTTIRQGRWNQRFGNLPSQEAIDAYLSRVDSTYAPGTVKADTSFGFNPDGSLFSIEPVYHFTGDTHEPLQPVEPSEYTYNYAPVNYLRLPMQRSSFFGRAGFDVTNRSELYLQALWARYTAARQVAPTPMQGVYVGADNPFIHPDFAALLATRPDPDAPVAFSKRMIDLGPRKLDAGYDVLQLLAGAGGELHGDWRYDVYASWGEVDQHTRLSGSVSKTAFEDLSFAPDAGASICGGEAMNPFGINSISSECAAYFARDANDRTTVTQLIAEATVSGPVFEWPAGSARLALGFLYKEDAFDYLADDVLSATRIDPVWEVEVWDITGYFAAVSVPGRTDSRELFVEANLPLLANVALARSLELALGYRYAEHSNSGAINAWKGETIWEVAGALTIRSSFQRAIRAPDFFTLFEPQTASTWELLGGEPCEYDWNDNGWGDDIAGAQQDHDVAALCIAQGIPADVLPTYFDSDQLIDAIGGGNPDLQEEKADTFTAGVVFRAPWSGALGGLQASIDYYLIEIENVIGYPSGHIYPCYDRATNPALDPDNFYCQRFERDPLSHEVTNYDFTAANIARMKTSGYDLQIDYVMDVGGGELGLHGLASHVLSASQKDAPGIPTREYKGLAKQTSLTADSAAFMLVPEWKVTVDTGYRVGGFDLNLRWQYIDSVRDGDIERFVVPSRQYLDVTTGYAFESGILAGLSMRAGVTNLTDEAPPVYPSSAEANTEPSTYDVLGRRYFVRGIYRF